MQHKLNTKKREKIEFVCNALALAGVILVLFLALGIQVFLNEEPCPLCLLQRVGLLAVSLGFLMNLCFGVHPSHYAMVILSSVYTSFVALRQIAINLSRPDGGFGTAIFGLHLYTWAFIIAMGIIIASTLIMGLERKYSLAKHKFVQLLGATQGLFIATVVLILLNILAVLNS